MQTTIETQTEMEEPTDVITLMETEAPTEMEGPTEEATPMETDLVSFMEDNTEVVTEVDTESSSSSSSSESSSSFSSSSSSSFSSSSSSSSSSPCHVEYILKFPYYTKNGNNPPEIKIGGKMLKEAGKAIADEILELALKNGNRLADLGANLSTLRLTFHVHLLVVYRFVHHGQPGDWQIIHKRKINSNQDVDYFVQIAPAQVRIKQELQKIEEKLEEELQEQCQNH